MRLAIIGIGHVAKYQLEALTNLDEINLVGAHDVQQKQANDIILNARLGFLNSYEVLVCSNQQGAVLDVNSAAHHCPGKFL